jgi:hypothetical protein
MQQLLSIAGLLLAGLTAGSAAAQALTTTAGSSLTVQSGATLYVAGGVQQASGASLANAGTVQLTGDLLNAGTLASPGLLLFSGSQDQTFSPGPATVANLTVGNTGTAGNNRLLLPTDLTVGTQLTLTQGLLRTQGSATLLLPNSARVVGEADGRYVQGRLQVARTAVSASAGSVDFTNGLVLNTNGQNLGAVTVTRTAGLQLGGVSYGQNLSGSTKGIDRVWQVTSSQPPAAGTPVSVTLSWVADDDNGFSLATSARLWRAARASGPWVVQGAMAAASGRSFTANADQLGFFTVSNTSQPLPVTLIRFTAELQGADALLRWATASELNSAYYEAESSTDGVVFQPLARVAGAGTANAPRQYQLTDPHVDRYGAHLIYYRLRQVDMDGTFSYSPVQTVRVGQATELAVYPNPAHGQVTVRGATSGIGLELIDALGRLVLRGAADAGGAAQLVLPAGLPAGVYVLRSGTTARRLVVE